MELTYEINELLKISKRLTNINEKMLTIDSTHGDWLTLQDLTNRLETRRDYFEETIRKYRLEESNRKYRLEEIIQKNRLEEIIQKNRLEETILEIKKIDLQIEQQRNKNILDEGNSF
jgi:hypothetical protein